MMHRAFSSIRRAVTHRYMSAEPVFSFEKPAFFGRPGSDAMKYAMRVVDHHSESARPPNTHLIHTHTQHNA